MTQFIRFTIVIVTVYMILLSLGMDYLEDRFDHPLLLHILIVTRLLHQVVVIVSQWVEILCMWEEHFGIWIQLRFLLRLLKFVVVYYDVGIHLLLLDLV